MSIDFPLTTKMGIYIVERPFWLKGLAINSVFPFAKLGFFWVFEDLK
jgi:hypothetical protein